MKTVFLNVGRTLTIDQGIYLRLTVPDDYTQEDIKTLVRDEWGEDNFDPEWFDGDVALAYDGVDDYLFNFDVDDNDRNRDIAELEKKEEVRL